MKSNLKFIRRHNISKVPLSYHFMDGFKLKPQGKFVDYFIGVDKYQSHNCKLFPHYKPISKIIR